MANEETVTVGCRLPLGLVLEVGLQRTIKSGPQNRPVAQVKRTEKYRTFQLRGTRAHTTEMRRQGIAVPSTLNPQPFINKDVPKVVWDQWKAENADSNILKRGEIFEVKGGGEDNAKAAALDALAKSPTPLTPLDRSKVVTVGSDKVETAKFDD